MTQTDSQAAPALARHLGLLSLVVYGVGDMVGAGIYGTIGDAAGRLGSAVWLAFLVSMVAALLTGLSYACLASRHPRAAGAAFVTQHALRTGWLSYVVGLAVTASGLTSMATSSNAFARELNRLVEWLPIWTILIGFIALLTLINLWGIRESMWTNWLCTAVEVGGLLLVIAVGARFWGGAQVSYYETPHSYIDVTGNWHSGLGVQMVLAGAVLTFFSFVGFEDMLNVAEEVKRPQLTMPLGMILALVVVTILYIAISVTAVSVVHWKDLSDASRGAPLVQITRIAAGWLPPWVFPAITMFAVANTALINYVMGSRLIYGMSRQGLLPAVLGRVHAGRRTPHVAILVLMCVATVLALTGGGGQTRKAVEQLASATALLLLLSFCIVNTSLVVLKLRPGEPRGRFEVPTIVPALGVLVCALLIIARLTRQGAGWQAPAIAGGLIALIGLAYLVARPKPVTEEALAEAERMTDD